MREFAILTNRKRVIVALVHTVVFLLLAVILSRNSVSPLELASPPGSWALAGVYLVVTSVLAMLVAFAGRSERLYFALCASSAALGLARQVLGDPRLHPAVWLRIALLGCAVLLGLALLRGYRSAAPATPAGRDLGEGALEPGAPEQEAPAPEAPAG